MIIICLIILVIVLINQDSKYRKLLEENIRLKEKLRKIENTNNSDKILENVENKITQEHETQAEKVIEKKTEENQQEFIKEEIKQEPRQEKKTVNVSFYEFGGNKVKKEKTIRDETEKKNVTILITGAICIVLSAIVFLMSTWNTIPNILKTIVLALLTAVFFECSHIAKEKFKLDKASQTFFYIAMAYIPIGLISISIFGLFGEYLSISGEGKYIYLMFASIFVATIYYLTYRNKNNAYLLIGSILSQIFGIISFCLILSNSLIMIGISLLLYNILLITLTKKDIFIKIYNIIPAIITLIAIINLEEQSKEMIIMLFLLATNFLILELKNSKIIYAYVFNIVLMTLGIYTIMVLKDTLGINLSYMFMLLFILGTYIIENLLLQGKDKKSLIDSLSVVTIISLGILHIESFSNESILAPYVVSAIQVMMLLITYMKSESRGKKITALLIPIYFIITGLNIISVLELSYHAYISFALMTFIIGEVFRKKERTLHINNFIISHVFIVLTYIFTLAFKFNEFSNDILYAVLLMSVYVYSFIIEKEETLKILSYITSNFVLFTMIKFLMGETELMWYIPMISTLAIMGIEKIYKNLQNINNDIYLLISSIISYALIYCIHNEIATILTILFTIIIIINNKFTEKDQAFNVLSLICVMPALFLNKLSTELELGLMLLSILITTMLSIKERKLSVYTIFSGIYLICTAFNIDSKYLNEILFICWSTIHMLVLETQNEKDVFRFLSYVSVLFLYNSIIKDLEMDTYTLFSMLGYITVAILTLRTIIINHIENIDILEYIVFGFLYITALMSYNNEQDGMLFGILLVTIVIISYLKKYGALFMISTFAILVNIFALTRRLWFSVPWWAYLLVIGSILIGFAIRNEITEKKNQASAVEWLKSIKDKVEK